MKGLCYVSIIQSLLKFGFSSQICFIMCGHASLLCLNDRGLTNLYLLQLYFTSSLKACSYLHLKLQLLDRNQVQHNQFLFKTRHTSSCSLKTSKQSS